MLCLLVYALHTPIPYSEIRYHQEGQALQEARLRKSDWQGLKYTNLT